MLSRFERKAVSCAMRLMAVSLRPVQWSCSCRSALIPCRSLSMFVPTALMSSYTRFSLGGTTAIAQLCVAMCVSCQLVMTCMKVRVRWRRAGDNCCKLQILTVSRLDLGWRLCCDNHGIGSGVVNATRGVDQ